MTYATATSHFTSQFVTLVSPVAIALYQERFGDDEELHEAENKDEFITQGIYQDIFAKGLKPKIPYRF